MKAITGIAGLIVVLSGPAYALTDYEQAEQLLQAGKAGQALNKIEANINTGNFSRAKKHEWLFLMARALSASGKSRQAVSTYRELIRQDAGFTEAYNNLAVIYAEQGDMDKASKMLEQALTQTDPVFATVYKNLQSVYVEMTRDSYGKALRLNMKPHKLSLKDISLVATARQKPAAPEFNPVQANADKADKPVASATQKNTAVADVSEAVKTTLLGWASAWSAQEVELYLSFYAKDFLPASGLTRRSWERQRKYRLQKPKWLKVTLNDIRVERLESNRDNSNDTQKVRVLLLQKYRSDAFTQKSRKQFVLHHTTEGWRILSEKNL